MRWNIMELPGGSTHLNMEEGIEVQGSGRG
jgi:hypothetical protein